MNRYLLVLLVVLVIAGVAIVAGTSSALPAQVMTHFGWQGAPDGASSRDHYTIGMIGQIVAEPLFVMAAFGLLPRAAPRLVSLPNRDYWLAPPRREATLRLLLDFGSGVAAAVVVLLTVLHLVIVSANTNGALPKMEPAVLIVVLLVFLVFIAIWSWRLRRRLRRPG